MTVGIGLGWPGILWAGWVLEGLEEWFSRVRSRGPSARAGGSPAVGMPTGTRLPHSSGILIDNAVDVFCALGIPKARANKLADAIAVKAVEWNLWILAKRAHYLRAHQP